MKGIAVPVVLMAAGFFGISQHDGIAEQWAAMFPDDPARQTALSHCFAEDHLFNRFSAEARAGCYSRWLTVEGPSAAPPAITVAAPNAVDQARAAGQGHQPQNDARSLDANRRYRHTHQ